MSVYQPTALLSLELLQSIQPASHHVFGTGFQPMAPITSSLVRYYNLSVWHSRPMLSHHLERLSVHHHFLGVFSPQLS